MKNIFRLRRAISLILTTDQSYRLIANQTGFAPNTVKRYKKVAKANLMTLEQLSSLDDEELNNVFSRKRGREKHFRFPNYSYVYKELRKKGVTLALLWNEYRLIDPNTAYSYSQYTYFYRNFTSQIDVSMRQVHYAGEECYIDFTGKLIPFTDNKVPQLAQVFVAVMGCSDKIFARACRSQKLECWINCHVHMFEYWGGVPAALIPDNLKSAVTKPGKIPQINRTYLDLAEHYDTAVLPARPIHPRDKSKGELGVKLVTQWIIARLRNRQFFSIEEINAAIAPLLEELNNRPFKRLPGCRNSRFDDLDRPMLKPLPVKPFVYGEWLNALKVGPDYHIYVLAHAYSVPYKLVSKSVEVRVTENEVEIFYLSKRVAIHKRSYEKGGATTDANHRPAQHQAFAQQALEDFILWAISIGDSATQVVKAQFHGRPEHSSVGAKACSQLKHLCSLHGKERFESACNHAIRLHSLTVKTVRSVLQSGADLVEQTPVVGHMPSHQNIRGAEYYSGGVR